MSIFIDRLTFYVYMLISGLCIILCNMLRNMVDNMFLLHYVIVSLSNMLCNKLRNMFQNILFYVIRHVICYVICYLICYKQYERDQCLYLPSTTKRLSSLSQATVSVPSGTNLIYCRLLRAFIYIYCFLTVSNL